MGVPQRGWVWSHAVSALAIQQLSRLSEVSRPCVECDRRFLGDRVTEHSRPHALRAQPAAADVRTGARIAGHYDAVFVDWNPGDFGNCGHLRSCHLGPGTTAEPLSFTRCRGNFA